MLCAYPLAFPRCGLSIIRALAGTSQAAMQAIDIAPGKCIYSANLRLRSPPPVMVQHTLGQVLHTWPDAAGQEAHFAGYLPRNFDIASSPAYRITWGSWVLPGGVAADRAPISLASISLVRPAAMIALLALRTAAWEILAFPLHILYSPKYGHARTQRIPQAKTSIWLRQLLLRGVLFSAVLQRRLILTTAFRLAPY